MAPKPAAEPMHMSVPVDRTVRSSSRTHASVSIRLCGRYSVASLNCAGTAPPTSAARTEGARDDRGGGGRASVHAVGRLAAARHPRTRVRRAAPRAAAGRWPAVRPACAYVARAASHGFILLVLSVLGG